MKPMINNFLNTKNSTIASNVKNTWCCTITVEIVFTEKIADQC